MAILSIHSRVSKGYVGNSAIVPALHALGHAVWPVDTVALSSHPGHGAVAGYRVSPEDVVLLADAVLGDALGGSAEAACKAVLTGYMGGVGQGRAALDVIGRVKQGANTPLFVCDPIMGDRDEGIYVDEDLPPLFRGEILPRADLALPNAFELELLTGISVVDADSAVAAAHVLRSRGTGAVVVTSVPDDPDPSAGGMIIGTLAVDGDGEWLIETPRLDRLAKGAGDVLTGLVVGHLLDGASLRAATARAVASVHGLMAAAGKADLDLPLVAERRLLAEPDLTLEPRAQG